MDLQNIYLKRGATLRAQISIGFDHADYEVSSSVTTRNFRDTLDVRKIIPTSGGIIEVSATPEQTSLWPQGLVRFDVRAVLGSEVVYTETITIIVIGEVTK